jgi:hypothetical protein
VRCCSFMAADGSMVAPVGWGGASHTMNDIFEGGRGRDSPPVTVVELGAGILLFADVCGLQSGYCFLRSGTGIVAVAMAFACAGAIRLDSSCSSKTSGGIMSSSSSSIRADIFMTDLAPFIEAAQLTLLQNKSCPSRRPLHLIRSMP